MSQVFSPSRPLRECSPATVAFVESSVSYDDQNRDNAYLDLNSWVSSCAHFLQEAQSRIADRNMNVFASSSAVQEQVEGRASVPAETAARGEGECSHSQSPAQKPHAATNNHISSLGPMATVTQQLSSIWSGVSVWNVALGLLLAFVCTTLPVDQYLAALQGTDIGSDSHLHAMHNSAIGDDTSHDAAADSHSNQGIGRSGQKSQSGDIANGGYIGRTLAGGKHNGVVGDSISPLIDSEYSDERVDLHIHNLKAFLKEFAETSESMQLGRGPKRELDKQYAELMASANSQLQSAWTSLRQKDASITFGTDNAMGNFKCEERVFVEDTNASIALVNEMNTQLSADSDVSDNAEDDETNTFESGIEIGAANQKPIHKNHNDAFAMDSKTNSANGTSKSGASKKRQGGNGSQKTREPKKTSDKPTSDELKKKPASRKLLNARDLEQLVSALSQLKRSLSEAESMHSAATTSMTTALSRFNASYHSYCAEELVYEQTMAEVKNESLVSALRSKQQLVSELRSNKARVYSEHILSLDDSVKTLDSKRREARRTLEQSVAPTVAQTKSAVASLSEALLRLKQQLSAVTQTLETESAPRIAQLSADIEASELQIEQLRSRISEMNQTLATVRGDETKVEASASERRWLLAELRKVNESRSDFYRKCPKQRGELQASVEAMSAELIALRTQFETATATAAMTEAWQVLENSKLSEIGEKKKALAALSADCGKRTKSEATDAAQREEVNAELQWLEQRSAKVLDSKAVIAKQMAEMRDELRHERGERLTALRRAEENAMEAMHKRNIKRQTLESEISSGESELRSLKDLLRRAQNEWTQLNSSLPKLSKELETATRKRDGYLREYAQMGAEMDEAKSSALLEMQRQESLVYFELQKRRLSLVDLRIALADDYFALTDELAPDLAAVEKRLANLQCAAQSLLRTSLFNN